MDSHDSRLTKGIDMLEVILNVSYLSASKYTGWIHPLKLSNRFQTYSKGKQNVCLFQNGWRHSLPLVIIFVPLSQDEF